MTAMIVVALVALEMFVMLAEQAITHAHEGTLAEAARAGRAGSERALWFRRFPDRLSAMLSHKLITFGCASFGFKGNKGCSAPIGRKPEAGRTGRKSRKTPEKAGRKSEKQCF